MKNDHVSSHTAPGSSQESASLVLEVQKGRTKFRRRPVDGRRFLIGSGRQCDLRLGGDAVPALHSVIHRNGGEIWIDAFAEAPPLRVNGHDVDIVRLEDGDTLEIADFQLVLRLQVAEAAETPVASPVPENTADGSLAGLTASQLVELIEKEAALVSDFEDRQQLGAEALLQAVYDRTTVKGRQAIPLPTRSMLPAAELQEQSLLGDLERVLLQLHSFSQKLESRSHKLLEREATHADAAATLLDAQHQLSEHLDKVLQRIVAEQHKPDAPARASA